jgi:hypothetical protein
MAEYESSKQEKEKVNFIRHSTVFQATLKPDQRAQHMEES